LDFHFLCFFLARVFPYIFFLTSGYHFIFLS
jgi:hypothetical protein